MTTDAELHMAISNAMIAPALAIQAACALATQNILETTLEGEKRKRHRAEQEAEYWKQRAIHAERMLQDKR